MKNLNYRTVLHIKRLPRVPPPEDLLSVFLSQESCLIKPFKGLWNTCRCKALPTCATIDFVAGILAEKLRGKGDRQLKKEKARRVAGGLERLANSVLVWKYLPSRI